MRKLRKNKFVVLAICVIVVSLAYFGVQKAIDNYAFKTNSDIVSEEEASGESNEGTADENAGKFSDEETDLVLEEVENVEAEEGEGTNESEAESSAEVEAEGEAQNKIYVYITGEVNVPGVLVLNEGSRIVDAINAACGTTAKANVTKVNLVYILEDGMKVNIPNNNDLKNNPDFEYITMSSGDGASDGVSEGTSRGDITSGSSFNSGSSKNYSIVNINTATQTELETLPGIGPSLALKIINYRKENGKFSSIDEIKNVSGIGESKFEELKGYITV